MAKSIIKNSYPDFIPDSEADNFFISQKKDKYPEFISDSEASVFFDSNKKDKYPDFIPDKEANSFFTEPIMLPLDGQMVEAPEYPQQPSGELPGYVQDIAREILAQEPQYSSTGEVVGTVAKAFPFYTAKGIGSSMQSLEEQRPEPTVLSTENILLKIRDDILNGIQPEEKKKGLIQTLEQKVFKDLKPDETIGKRLAESSDKVITDIEKNLKLSRGQEILYSGLSSVAQNLPGYILGAITGNPTYPLASIALSSDRYYDIRKERPDLSPGAAFGLSVFDKGVEVMTELMPMKTLFSKSPNLVKKFISYLAKEIPGEMTATAFQEGIVSKLSTNPDMTLKDLAVAVGVDTPLSTIISSSILGGGTIGTQQLIKRLAKENINTSKIDVPEEVKADLETEDQTVGTWGEEQQTIPQEQVTTQPFPQDIQMDIQQREGVPLETPESAQIRPQDVIIDEQIKQPTQAPTSLEQEETIQDQVYPTENMPKTNFSVEQPDDLQSIVKTAKKVDDYIEEFIPPVGLSIKEQKAKNVSDDIEQPKSVNQEVELRWKLAKGIKKESLPLKIKKGFVKGVQSFQRKYPELDTKQEVDAKVNDILRNFENVSEFSKAAATKVIQGITAQLGKKKYDVFSRKIILEDLKKDINKGLYNYEDLETGEIKQKELPFGYKNLEEINIDLKQYNKIIESNTDIKSSLDARNSFINTLKKELVENNLLPEKVLDYESYFHHQVLEKLAEKNFKGVGTGSQKVKLGKKGFQKKRIGSSKDFNTDYLESEFEVISQSLSQLETVKTLKELRAITDISESLKVLAKEQNIKDYKKLTPEGYVVWKPKYGNHFYLANSLTEKTLDAVMSGTKTLEDSDVKKVLAIGRNQEWIIPKHIAETLDNLKDYGKDSAPAELSKSLLSSWKQWVLINPFRVLKYNINNMSGDLDITFAYDPAIIKKSPSAAKDLLSYTRGKAPTPEILEAIKYGVIGSGMTIKEIPDISKIGLFKVLTGENPNLIQKYWNNLKDYTQWRENILRLSAYRYFKEAIKKGKNPYGASKKTEVDAIGDVNKKAAKLARELLGDYGNISKGGQWLRERMIPFYSWMEINAPRYVRLFKNLKHEGKGTGKLFGAGIIKAGYKTTKLGIKATILYVLINLWNNIFFSDEEKELSNEQRRQAHIILGRRDDGSIISLSFQGALSDALDWFGFEDLPDDIKDITSGDKNFREKTKETLLAPITKAIQGIRPEPKLLFETLTKKSLYPDPFNPRPIRDVGEHLSRTVSAQLIYNYLKGKPLRSIDKELSKALVYDIDPGESAYWVIKQKAIEFLEDKGREFPSITPTKRSNSLYYWRQAVKYGDNKAAKKYLKQYFRLGGTIKGLKISLLKQSPISFIPKKLQSEFINTLNKEERKIFKKGYSWYLKTYTRKR
jgi:hypothetical protein